MRAPRRPIRFRIATVAVLALSTSLLAVAAACGGRTHGTEPGIDTGRRAERQAPAFDGGHEGIAEAAVAFPARHVRPLPDELESHPRVRASIRRFPADGASGSGR